MYGDGYIVGEALKVIFGVIVTINLCVFCYLGVSDYRQQKREKEKKAQYDLI